MNPEGTDCAFRAANSGGMRGIHPPNIWPPSPPIILILAKNSHQKNFGGKNMGFSTPKQEVLESSPQYQKIHQNMLIIPPMLDTDLQPWAPHIGRLQIRNSIFHGRRRIKNGASTPLFWCWLQLQVLQSNQSCTMYPLQ